jgi:hypothetical protein
MESFFTVFICVSVMCLLWSKRNVSVTSTLWLEFFFRSLIEFCSMFSVKSFAFLSRKLNYIYIVNTSLQVIIYWPNLVYERQWFIGAHKHGCTERYLLCMYVQKVSVWRSFWWRCSETWTLTGKILVSVRLLYLFKSSWHCTVHLRLLKIISANRTPGSVKTNTYTCIEFSEQYIS